MEIRRSFLGGLLPVMAVGPYCLVWERPKVFSQPELITMGMIWVDEISPCRG
jgi:hypothetical protein